MINKNELLQLLKDTGALLEGHFKLTSGRHSNRYIEKFRVLENPDALDQVCRAMAYPYNDKKIELVLGAAVGGILLAGGVGRHLKVKHIFSERVNGKMVFRRGFHFDPGMRILIVEDIVTTGFNLFLNSLTELRLRAETQRDLCEITWVCSDAVQHFHMAVNRQAQSAAQIIARQGDHRCAHGE